MKATSLATALEPPADAIACLHESALAHVERYLRQPVGAFRPHLLNAEIGGTSNIRSYNDEAGKAVMAFDLWDRKRSEARTVICHPDALALLLVIIVCGQSVFLDHTGGKTYVKVGGKANDSAGIMFPRLLMDAGEGENVTAENGKDLDLRFENLKRKGGAGERDAVDYLGMVLSKVATLPANLFGEDLQERHARAQALYDIAVERVSASRESTA